MTNKTFDRLMNAAMASGLLPWITLAYFGHEAVGILLGAALSFSLMYLMYRVSERQRARDRELQQQEVDQIVAAYDESLGGRHGNPPTLH